MINVDNQNEIIIDDQNRIDADLGKEILSDIPLREVTNGTEAKEWFDAIVQELRSIIKKDTWTIVIY